MVVPDVYHARKQAVARPHRQKLGTYQFNVHQTGSGNNIGYSVCSTLMSSDQYFGGRRLAVMDQLGSAGTSSSPAPSYFPWGEPRNTSPEDTWSFGTYWTDSVSGLDYAMNRYYNNAYGRFMTPDPYQGTSGGSGDANNPQSWNRYAYTVGDPVNWIDPSGQFYQPPQQPPDQPLPPIVNSNPTTGPSPSQQKGQHAAPPATPAAITYFGSLQAQNQQAQNSITGQDLSLAMNALKNPACASLFGTTATRAGAWNPQNVLTTLYSPNGGNIAGTNVSVGFLVSTVTLGIDASVWPTLGGMGPGAVLNLTVLINSSTWNATQNSGIGNSGADFNAATLLHELGHLYAMTAGDGSGGSSIRSDWYDPLTNGPSSPSYQNQQTILKTCFGISY